MTTDATTPSPGSAPLDDDAAARRRILGSLDESLLVEAAAGTGKTTQLVGRLVALLGSGRATVDRIVAVTFTRKAAGEMKLRLRQELDRARLAAAGDEPRRACLEAAIARLEEARIGTIHSFCAELLRERPVEAGVDPGFAELDEDEAGQLYDRAFRGWVERRLDALPPGLSRALTRLAVAARPTDPAPLEQIRGAGRALVDWRDYPAPWQRRPFERREAVDRVFARVGEVARLARQGQARDPLRRALEPADALVRAVAAAEAVSERDHEALEARLLAELAPALRRQARWRGRGRLFAEGVPREELLARREDLMAELETLQTESGAELAALLKGELDEVTSAYEEIKRRAGKLDFLDLLLLTRDLLVRRPEVRRFYQERFSHVFVDEFQDTDPLQAEVLLLLAADDPAVVDWRLARPVPGKLFLVGDPKQSIYRFRRADVLLYQGIKERLAAAGVAVVHLARSFRAVRPLQEAVNAAFAPEMAGDRASGQPEYVPLVEHRPALPGQPALVALPVPRPYGWRGVTRRAVEESLPAAAAAFVAWLLAESGWRVEDPVHRGGTVPVAPRHVCLLFRRYVSWGDDMTTPYVRALEARGIPHLLVGGRSLHQREEVETLRLALTAVEWPDDELAVFATLKRSLFALPDELLLRFRLEVGRLHPFRPHPADLAAELAPVGAALEILARLHRSRNRIPVVATLNELLRVTRAHAGFALLPAGHQILANVQQVVELARRFDLKGGSSFRAFVEWLDSEATQPESRQAPVLEEGAEGVRIMTVHNAKGLEFPVVLLADITARRSRQTAERHVDAEAGLCALRLLGCAPWELAEGGVLEGTRDEAEGQRIAYVAATRARDLLVVPAVGVEPMDGWVGALNKALYPPPGKFRVARAAPGCPAFGDASVLERPADLASHGEDSVRPGLHRPAAGEHDVVWWDPALLDLDVEERSALRGVEIVAPDAAGEAAGEGLARYQQWQATHAAALAAGARPAAVVRAVTQLDEDPPAAVHPVEISVLPRPAGRPSGARFGSLVHGVLRDVALRGTPAEVGRLGALQARLLGATPEEEAAAVAAVAAALDHPVLVRAVGAERVERESPFVLALGEGRLIEGTIDFAFLEEGTWTVIDFKTDLGAGAAPAVEEAYRRQVAWYLFAVERLTGRPARGLLLGV